MPGALGRSATLGAPMGDVTAEVPSDVDECRVLKTMTCHHLIDFD